MSKSKSMIHKLVLCRLPICGI